MHTQLVYTPVSNYTHFVLPAFQLLRDAVQKREVLLTTARRAVLGLQSPQRRLDGVQRVLPLPRRPSQRAQRHLPEED